MTAKNLSTVANDLIESYGNTAKNVIRAYRAGGERVVSLLESRWNKALKQSRPELDAEVAKNASAAQHAFSSYYSKGLVYSSQGAQHVVTRLVELAAAGVDSAAANASRFEEKTGLTTLSTIAKTTASGALVLSSLASKIEHKSASLARKVAGDHATTARVKRAAASKPRRASGKATKAAA